MRACAASPPRAWTKAAIAREVHGPQAAALQLRRTQVTARNAEAVEALAARVLPESARERRARINHDADDIDALYYAMADAIEARRQP